MMAPDQAAWFARALDGALSWRPIGPYRGGRTMAVVGHPSRSRVGYMGTASGGVWLTEDGGANWRNISDRYFKRGSVGALALSEADPGVLYAGMGECGMRANVTHGDGVYRSADGGATWTSLGLAETHNIGRILIHPRDPDQVYVAAFGHRFGPNPARGVYRTRDGGRSWTRVLHVNDDAGAVDLAIDTHAPHIVYAAMWQARRGPWSFTTRGPASGLYRSEDGGATWTDLARNPGFPPGSLGRIGVCCSPVDPDRLWALVDAPARGGVYRSDDAGATWTWLNGDHNFLARAWYSARIVADPRDVDTLYLPNRKLWRSTDGGRTFVQMNTPYWDQHDLWVDPRDPAHLMVGTDGGAGVSFDGGASWSTIFNQPTAELYHVATDNRFPYRVYSAQQDNSTLCLPSRSDRGPISLAQLYDVGGGESGHIAVRPDNPDIIYASDLDGVLTRYDHASGQLRPITPWPDSPEAWDAAERPYRFNWSTPIALSPHDPTILYTAANRVLRSRDEGGSWEVISPDLTRHDAAKMAAPGGETGDYCTIATLAESPLAPGVLWVGSDDGLIHLSRDGGATWRDVTPPGLPRWATTCVEASPHDPGGAYVSATLHALDDFRPYLFKTTDYGASWDGIVDGIPADQFTRVVRADPSRRGLLYAGTEAGVYVSLDDGRSWHPLQLDLPAVAIYDLAVKDGDLIAATHGRGLWIIDDLSPLHQVSAETLAAPLSLFIPRPAYRVAREAYGVRGYIHMGFAHAAPNPPSGVVVTYYLRDEPATGVTITLFDPDGREIVSYSSEPPTPPAAPLGPYDYVLRHGVAVLTARAAGEEERGIRVGAWGAPRDAPWPSARAGLNRFALNLLYPPARTVPGYPPLGVTSPLAPPGAYAVRLTVGDVHLSVPCEVVADPRATATQADLQAQFALMRGVRDGVTALHDAVAVARDLRRQVDDWGRLLDRVSGAQAARAEAARLAGRLRALEATLIQPDYTERSGELAASHYRLALSNRLEALGNVLAGYDGAPTAQAAALYAELSALVEQRLADLRAVIETDLPAFNALVRASGVPAVVPPVPDHVDTSV